jgi:hypothetical protein
VRCGKFSIKKVKDCSESLTPCSKRNNTRKGQPRKRKTKLRIRATFEDQGNKRTEEQQRNTDKKQE